MKEATGELNMTVITVVAIVAVGALFTFFVWPTVKANLAINTACSTIDSHGNTSVKTSSKDDTEESTDGEVSCQNFECTVTYDGKEYTGNCKDKSKTE